MATNFEFQPQKNEKPPVSHFHLRLNIIRHGQKDGPNEVTHEEDLVMRLKPIGREQAVARGKEFGTTGGTASGSPRLRTQETALFMAHANDPRVTGKETFEELAEKLGLMIGPINDGELPQPMTWPNRKLDMPFDKDHPDTEMIFQKANEGVLLKWFSEQDDAAVAEGGDRSKTIYGMQAYNIASIVDRFARVASKMADRAAVSEQNGEKAVTEREQNMGTHGSISESFLAEVLRRTKGDEERKKFIAHIPNGVAVTEGMFIDMDATSDGKEPAVRIRFNIKGKDGSEYRFDEPVPLSLVKGIVDDFAPKTEEA